MTNDEALLAIQEAMDGVEWTPDTLDAIAKIMQEAGYRIRNMDDRDEAIVEHVPLKEEFDNATAEAEGWIISRVSGAKNGDSFRLERDDAAEIFEDEYAAWRHVAKRAAEGSAYPPVSAGFSDEEPAERVRGHLVSRSWRTHKSWRASMKTTPKKPSSKTTRKTPKPPVPKKPKTKRAKAVSFSMR